MGLYCTRWLMGEEQLRDLAKNYWEFRILFGISCTGRIGVEFHHFSEEGEAILFNNIPQHSKREFISRYQMASEYMLTHISFNVVEYINDRLQNEVPDADEEALYDLFEDIGEEVQYQMNHVQTLDFVPLYERFISLIFFDSWTPIPHYKFLIYPKKK